MELITVVISLRKRRDKRGSEGRGRTRKTGKRMKKKRGRRR